MRAASIAILTAAAIGCGSSPPSRFYTLNSTAAADGAPAASYSVAVGPVSVPASVDRVQFVTHVAPNRVALDEFNRWAAPLEDNIARTVAGDLASLLGSPRVSTAPFAPLDFTYRVTINVQRFESIPGKEAVIDAVWSVRKAAGGDPRSGRTLAREAAEGEGFEALAAAHSRALASVSKDIAAALRTEAEKKP